MLLLRQAGVIEVQNREGDESTSSYLHFSRDLSPDTRRRVTELKQILDLSPEMDSRAVWQW